jgi:hypothetical protein
MKDVDPTLQRHHNDTIMSSFKVPMLISCSVEICGPPFEYTKPDYCSMLRWEIGERR